MAKGNQTSDNDNTEEIKPSEVVAEDKKDDKKEERRKEYDFTDFSSVWQGLTSDKLSDERIGEEISKSIAKLAVKYKVNDYNILFLYDEHTSLSSTDANKIYDAINLYTDKKDILRWSTKSGHCKCLTSQSRERTKKQPTGYAPKV